MELNASFMPSNMNDEHPNQSPVPVGALIVISQVMQVVTQMEGIWMICLFSVVAPSGRHLLLSSRYPNRLKEIEREKAELWLDLLQNQLHERVKEDQHPFHQGEKSCDIQNLCLSFLIFFKPSPPFPSPFALCLFGLCAWCLIFLLLRKQPREFFHLYYQQLLQVNSSSHIYTQ